MQRESLKHYSFNIYEDEEELAKFLDKQTKASESIKYIIARLYEQIGYKDLFEYLKNNDLNISVNAKHKGKSVKPKKSPSNKPKKKEAQKHKKEEINLSDENLNADLSHWAQTGNSF